MDMNKNKKGLFIEWLEEGLNLISIPLIQDDWDRAVVLSSIDGDYDFIYDIKQDGEWDYVDKTNLRGILREPFVAAFSFVINF